MLADLDLNLLRTLDVLLAERSVSRAAHRLHRSQPAVSHALRKLREHLGDPLLVRQGRGLVPTPRAQALAEPLHALLAELERVLERTAAFDPSTTERRFRIACPPLLAPFLPDLLRAIHDEAPRAGLEVLDRSGADALAAADLVLGPLPDEAPGVVARRLGTVEQAVLMRADHPAAQGPMDVDRWLAHPHARVRTRDDRPSFVDRALVELGRTRRIGVVLPDLLLVPHVVARSDLFFTGPRQVLRPLCGPLGLVLRDPPVAMPSVPVAALWQQRLSHDPGHRWLRQHVVDVLVPFLDGAHGRAEG
jgi:DNA-binding transcriptional LysR family regulator